MDGQIAYFIPIIVGLVEVIKRVTGVDSKFAPLLSIILGILLSWAGTFYGTATEFLFTGIIAGLSASGLYDTAGRPIIKGAEEALNNS